MNSRHESDPRTPLLLAVVAQTLAALQHDRERAPPVTLDSVLDRDLGLDSLARVELLVRVEQAFGVALPENTLQVAQTPRDLLAALDGVRALAPAARDGDGHRQPGAAVRHPAPVALAAGEESPSDATTSMECKAA